MDVRISCLSGVWMCVFHGGHSLPVVGVCAQPANCEDVCLRVAHGCHSLPVVERAVLLRLRVTVFRRAHVRSAAMRCSCTYLCRKLPRLLPAFRLTQHVIACLKLRHLLEARRS